VIIVVIAVDAAMLLTHRTCSYSYSCTREL